MKNLEDLRTELNNNFVGNDICIEMLGDITIFFKMQNIQFLLNELNLIISNTKQNQLSIYLDEVKSIEVKETLINIHFNYNETVKIYT